MGTEKGNPSARSTLKGKEKEMTKGIITEKEWTSGTSSSTSPEKASKVLSFLQTLGKKGANMNAIAQGSGLKWPYTTVRNLVKVGTLEEKKIGKANFFRIKGGARAK